MRIIPYEDCVCMSFIRKDVQNLFIQSIHDTALEIASKLYSNDFNGRNRFIVNVQEGGVFMLCNDSLINNVITPVQIQSRGISHLDIRGTFPILLDPIECHLLFETIKDTITVTLHKRKDGSFFSEFQFLVSLETCTLEDIKSYVELNVKPGEHVTELYIWTRKNGLDQRYTTKVDDLETGAQPNEYDCHSFQCMSSRLQRSKEEYGRCILCHGIYCSSMCMVNDHIHNRDCKGTQLAFLCGDTNIAIMERSDITFTEGAQSMILPSPATRHLSAFDPEAKMNTPITNEEIEEVNQLAQDIIRKKKVCVFPFYRLHSFFI